MSEIFTDEIIGMNALTGGGYPIGRVEEIVIDTETGAIKYLLVRAVSGSLSTQKTDAQGRTIVSFNSLKISGENVIVS